MGRSGPAAAIAPTARRQRVAGRDSYGARQEHAVAPRTRRLRPFRRSMIAATSRRRRPAAPGRGAVVLREHDLRNVLNSRPPSCDECSDAAHQRVRAAGLQLAIERSSAPSTRPIRRSHRGHRGADPCPRGHRFHFHPVEALVRDGHLKSVGSVTRRRRTPQSPGLGAMLACFFVNHQRNDDATRGQSADSAINRVAPIIAPRPFMSCDPRPYSVRRPPPPRKGASLQPRRPCRMAAEHQRTHRRRPFGTPIRSPIGAVPEGALVDGCNSVASRARSPRPPPLNERRMTIDAISAFTARRVDP